MLLLNLYRSKFDPCIVLYSLTVYAYAMEHSQPNSQFIPRSSASQPPQQQKTDKKNGKKILYYVAVGLLVVAIGVASYLLGAKKRDAAHTEGDTHAQTASLSVPKDATVSAECAEGRGKQYISPKNIPDGPIYDVNNGKVVAIEYLVEISKVAATPEKFMDLELDKAAIDHITVLSVDPHAGFEGQHVHVIASVIPFEEMNSIKCGNSTTSHSTSSSAHDSATNVN